MINAIEVSNIVKKYGSTTVLANVSFQVPKGAICGFVGKNGAGKTTMLRILTDLQKADSGEYGLFGVKNNAENAATGKLGAIVEAPALYLEMTAEENLRQLFRIKGRRSFEGITDLLKLVGLEDTHKKKVKDFSLGMKQKLGLAMALEGNPELIILDEPMNGLDPQGIIQLRKLILALNRDKGITFLISSHMLEELTKVATHYIFIDHGRIIRQMTAGELEKESKRTVCITVSDQTVAEKALKENKISYSVIQPSKLSIDSEITITDLIISLKELGCDVLRCYEQDENLEEFFVSMLEEEA